MFEFRIGSLVINSLIIFLTIGPLFKPAVADDSSLKNAAEHWQARAWPLLQK